MSSYRPVAAALVVLAASALPAVRAERLPEWARRIAETAPSLGDEVEDHDSRVLWSETRLVVSPQGTFEIRRRLAAQALRKGAAVSNGWFHASRGTKLEAAHAWHLPPEGGRPGTEAWRRAVSLDPSFLTDQVSHVVHLEGVRRGSLVFFEFEAEKTPTTLAFSLLFDEHAPTDAMTLEVAIPEGWEARHEWLRSPGPEPVVDGRVRRFAMRDLPGPVDEPLATPASSRAPLLWVGLVPPPGSRTVAPALSDLASFGVWYEALSRGKDAVTPEIRAAAERACETSGSDPGARVRAMVRFVRDRVRYVAREIGIGRYQPRPAAQVLGELLGDCKDKANLLRAILASEGIPSYPILVNAVEPETFARSVPSPAAFDHVAVGVRYADGIDAEDALRSAVFEAGRLGPLVVVDATNEYAAIGEVPAALSGKTAVVCAGERTAVATLPGTDARDHRTEERLELSLLADRSLRGRTLRTLHGQPAIDARTKHRVAERDRRAEVEREIEARWNGARLEVFAAEDESPTGAFQETFEWTVPAAAGNGVTIPLFPGGTDFVSRPSLVHRAVPVVYAYARSLRMETTIATAPPGLALPEPRDFSGDGWAVSSRVTFEGSGIRAVLEINLSRLRFSPDEFDELRRLWAAIDRAASPAIPYPR